MFFQSHLEIAALEMGISIQPGTDIFRSLIVAGKAEDFDKAVVMVARHLDASAHPSDDPYADLSDGKIERRVSRRNR